MNIKVFNIRLSKEHCQNDQAKMNEFLELSRSEAYVN